MTGRASRRRGLIIAGILASFLCIGAWAAPSANTLALARQLVKELDVKALHDTLQAECLKEGGTLDVAELYKEDPAPFGGLSPKSAYWPEVEGIFRRQQLRVCQAFSVDDYADGLARQIAERLPGRRPASGSDMEAVKAVLQEVIDEAIPVVVESALQSMDATRERYTDLMVAELTDIVERYQREPK